MISVFNVMGKIFLVRNKQHGTYLVEHDDWKETYYTYGINENVEHDVILSALDDCPIIDRNTANCPEEDIRLLGIF